MIPLLRAFAVLAGGCLFVLLAALAPVARKQKAVGLEIAPARGGSVNPSLRLTVEQPGKHTLPTRRTGEFIGVPATFVLGEVEISPFFSLALVFFTFLPAFLAIVRVRNPETQ